MSKQRISTLLASKSITTAGTETIDVDLTTCLSKIMIIEMSTSAGTAQTAHPVGNITKVELVDGSKVIASLSGYQAQALDFYNSGVLADNYISDVSGVQHYSTININFGRWLWDTFYALNPARFDNPQLKITHNYRVADTAASAGTLEAYAFAFDKKSVAPVGYLMPKEHFAYTSGAEGAIEYVTLPTDHVIRRALFRGAAADYFPWQVINKVKVTENGEASVPFDFSVSAYLKHIVQEYPKCRESGLIALKAATQNCYCAPTFTIFAHPITETVTNIVSIDSSAPTVPFKFDVTADDEAVVEFSGKCPHYAFPLNFGDQEDPDDWYDATELDNLKVQLTSGSAGTNGAISLVLEQVQKY